MIRAVLDVNVIISAVLAPLVTGDKRLRALDSYHGVTILNPREFLDLLTSQSEQ